MSKIKLLSREAAEAGFRKLTQMVMTVYEMCKFCMSNEVSPALIAQWKTATRVYTGSTGKYEEFGGYSQAGEYFTYCGARVTPDQVRDMLAYRYCGAPGTNARAYKDKWWLTATLPLHIQHATSIESVFASCRRMQIAVLYDYYPTVCVTNLNNAFNGCVALKNIKGSPIDLSTISTTIVDAFKNCKELQEVWLTGLKVNISFADSAYLRWDCIGYMVENAVNTTPITITLHNSLYETIPANLITKALEKHITFATV